MLVLIYRIKSLNKIIMRTIKQKCSVKKHRIILEKVKRERSKYPSKLKYTRGCIAVQGGSELKAH